VTLFARRHNAASLPISLQHRDRNSATIIEQRSVERDGLNAAERSGGAHHTTPGSSERGYLSVCPAYCDTEKLFDVAPGSFRPAPKVWSSVRRLTLRSNCGRCETKKRLWQLSRGIAQNANGFSTTYAMHRRRWQEPSKLWWRQHSAMRAEVDLQRRAEHSRLKEWARIAHTLE